MSFINELIEKIIGKQSKEHVALIGDGKTNIDDQTIEPKDIKVEYFSKIQDGIHKHDVRIIYDGEEISVGNFSNEKDKNNKENSADISIKEIVKEIQSVVTQLNEAESKYGLDNLKEKTKDILEEISQKNPNFVLDEEIMSFIEDFQPEQVIDYEKLDNLPKKIDVDRLTQSQKKTISIKMRSRMKELEQIHNTEDAWEDREKLLSFIKSIENTPLNPLIDANIESEKKGIELDGKTSKLVAKEIQNIGNEDGALYSVYLKIQEKRIWKKIKLTIAEHANDNEMDKEDLGKLMESIGKLNTYELHDIQGGLSSEVLTYIIDQIKEMDTEKYLEEVKENDSLLARMINSKFPNMENKDKILPFFYNRIASLGQLSNKKGNLLRKFVETTDFIDEDNTEAKQFLLLVSQIEKVYIKNQCKDLLEISNERDTTNTNSFKERIASSAKSADKIIINKEVTENTKQSEDLTK